MFDNVSNNGYYCYFKKKEGRIISFKINLFLFGFLKVIEIIK